MLGRTGLLRAGYAVLRAEAMLPAAETLSAAETVL